MLATYTYSTNTRMESLEPLAVLLSQKTGIEVTAVSYPTVQRLLEAIKHDSVDFAMMNTSGYLTFQKEIPNKIVPLVNLYMGIASSTNYGGCIIVLNETGIPSIKHFLVTDSSYRFALVNNSSTSGNLVPRLLLNNIGIDNAEKKFQVYYAGTHKNVVEDIINGKAALGGCGCAEVEKYKGSSAYQAILLLLIHLTIYR